VREKKIMRYAIGLYTCAAALALAGGCARPGAVEEAKRTLNADALVRMSGFSFMPKHITIKAGQSVEWNNTAALETHTVTADPALAKTKDSVALPPGAATFNSGDLKPTQTFRYVFTVPGTYRYFCIPHERMGMVGEVEVLPAPAPAAR
jgi:plastocyanin